MIDNNKSLTLKDSRYVQIFTATSTKDLEDKINECLHSLTDSKLITIKYSCSFASWSDDDDGGNMVYSALLILGGL